MSKKSKSNKSPAPTADATADLPALAAPPASSAATIPDHAVDSFFEDLSSSIHDIDSPYGRAKAEVEHVEKILADKKAVLKFEADKLRAAINAIKSPQVCKAFDAQIYDDALRACLGTMNIHTSGYVGNKYNHKIPVKGVIPWPTMVKEGATDAQIDSNLRNGFGPIQSYWSSGHEIGLVGKCPVFIHRDGRGTDEELIEPDMLVDEIRRVFSIPQPKPAEKKPAPKPAATKASTKATKKGKASPPDTKPAKKKPSPSEVKIFPAPAAKQISAKPAKPAKEKDDGFGNITSMKLEKDGKGIWRLKYRKGTHTKLIYVGDKHPSAESARDAAIAAFNKKEKLEYPAASIGMPEEFKEPPVRDIDGDVEAPSNPDQSPGEDAADLSSDAAPAPVKTPHVIFLSRNADYYVRSPDLREPLKLEAQDADAARIEAGEWLDLDASEITVGGIEDVPAEQGSPSAAETSSAEAS